MNPTPRPWRCNTGPKHPIYAEEKHQKIAHVLYGRQTGVTEDEAMANLALIVRAVNSFELMKRALEEIEPFLAERGIGGNMSIIALRDMARAALAAAD